MNEFNLRAYIVEKYFDGGVLCVDEVLESEVSNVLSDSIKFVSMVVEIEELTGIVFEDEKLIPATFSKVRDIFEYVENLSNATDKISQSK